MILELPYPPTSNTLHAVVRGRKVLSKAGRAYYVDAGRDARRQAENQREPLFNGSQRLSYQLDVFPPDRRKRDLSNVAKAFEDALTTAAIWADDSQVDEIIIRRRAPCNGGKLCVIIREIPAEQAIKALT